MDLETAGASPEQVQKLRSIVDKTETADEELEDVDNEIDKQRSIAIGKVKAIVDFPIKPHHSYQFFS